MANGRFANRKYRQGYWHSYANLRNAPYRTLSAWD